MLTSPFEYCQQSRNWVGHGWKWMLRYVQFLLRSQASVHVICILVTMWHLLVHYTHQVKSVFGAKMFALGVVIKIPVPKQTAKTNFQVTSGRAKYNPSIDSLVWKWVFYIQFPAIFSILPYRLLLLSGLSYLFACCIAYYLGFSASKILFEFNLSSLLFSFFSYC